MTCSSGEFPVAVDFSRFAPGSHTLLITATSTDGETATSDVPFTVPEPLGMLSNASLS